VAHVEPLDRTQIEKLEPFVEGTEAGMGFVPNSMLTMAHMRQLPAAFSLFGADVKTVMASLGDAMPDQNDPEDSLPRPLVHLIAYSASLSAGCRYCQAHTSHSGHRLGEVPETFLDVLSYTTSDIYSPAEKAVIALSLAAAQVPNGSDSDHFAVLREHFSERQIAQIVAVILLFGFLNRWNDTMAIQLEGSPTDFSASHPDGWGIGKHAGAQ